MKTSCNTRLSGCTGPVTVWKIVCAVLALATLECGTVTASKSNPKCQYPDKDLWVLAGPRRTATSSVADFLYQYARGPQPGRKDGKTYHPLAKFRWPMVYGTYTNKTYVDEPYKRFNHLVTDYNNENVRNEILEAIKKDYEQQYVNGVIFGGEEFEQVGVHAQNGYDAIQAVRAAVEITGAKPECVTIIINYRVPRFEHWVSLYSDTTKDDPMPYNQHMCEEKSVDDRVQELGCSMNPLYLAETYLAEGWNVKVIDMGGVGTFSTDIAHTISCEVMGGACDDDGWVKNHGDQVFDDKALEYEFDHLSDEEKKESEKLFRYRDCAYQEDLESNPNFGVVMPDSIWKDCKHDQNHEWIYQTFRDEETGTKLFYDGLLSQVDCSEYGGAQSAVYESNAEILETAKIDEFLSGEYQQKTGLVERIEEAASGFSAPLIIAIAFVAAGVAFYLHKVRENPNYKIPGIEMSPGFGDRSKSHGFTDEPDDDDDDSSSDEDSDDEDDAKFV